MPNINRMVGKPEMLQSSYDVERAYGVELRACPFCGGVPSLYRGPSPHVVCTSCAAEGPVFESRRDNRDAVAHRALVAWNRRTQEG